MGDGDKPDNDYLSKIEDRVVNIISPTVVYGHG
ncbi:Myb DNA-bind 5 domain-containing protein, partial [Aphis craccivora]